MSFVLLKIEMMSTEILQENPFSQLSDGAVAPTVTRVIQGPNDRIICSSLSHGPDESRNLELFEREQWTPCWGWAERKRSRNNRDLRPRKYFTTLSSEKQKGALKLPSTQLLWKSKKIHKICTYQSGRTANFPFFLLSFDKLTFRGGWEQKFVFVGIYQQTLFFLLPPNLNTRW